MTPKFRVIAAVLLLSPSFNIWSSVASKESIIVFSVSIICAHIISIYNNDHKIKFILFLAAYILIVFKPHYLIPIVFIYGSVIASKYIKQKEALIFIVGIISLLFLYIFRAQIDELSFDILPHFLSDAGLSTRLAYWQEPYDVFFKAPTGMILSFVGPTLEESLSNPLQMVSMIESALTIAALFAVALLRDSRMPAFSFLVVLFSVSWLLFVNYPFGIMNPGSAIRYRTGYYVIIVMAFVILLSREAHINWRLGRKSSTETRKKAPSRWRFEPKFAMEYGVKFRWRWGL